MSKRSFQLYWVRYGRDLWRWDLRGKGGNELFRIFDDLFQQRKEFLLGVALQLRDVEFRPDLDIIFTLVKFYVKLNIFTLRLRYISI